MARSGRTAVSNISYLGRGFRAWESPDEFPDFGDERTVRDEPLDSGEDYSSFS